jgi:hypothetical protein
MCDQCNHLREFLKQRFDPLTEERIKAMIADLEQRKGAMHLPTPVKGQGQI